MDIRPELLAGISGVFENQLEPQMMVDALVRIAEEESSRFRNVVPEAVADWIKAIQAKTWEAGKDDSLWIDPEA